MIIIEDVIIKINSQNISHFKKIGYCVNNEDIITIKSNELSQGSHIKVKVKCDRCGVVREISYRQYLKQREKYNFDTCIKCKSEKTKKTNLIKYGVEYACQNIKVKDKLKKTMLERYGVENPSNSKMIREKTKKTNLEKYGTEYSWQNENVKNKSKKTKQEKYGDENFTNKEKSKKTKQERYGDENYNNREQCKTTNLEKYGVENVSQNEKIKNKKISTCLKNYGVEHPLQSLEIMDKLKTTNLEKLGVPHPTMSKIINNKIFDTNIKSGRWLKIEERNDYYNYYLIVCKYTLQNKKELLDNWNGYDYYSDDYILENFKMNSNDKNYPTIDHKKSVRYGFDNNISPEEISNINNLCITTRSNNSSKGKKNEKFFNFKK